MKRFVAIILFIPILLSAISCAKLSRSQLEDFLSSDGSEILEELYGFGSYVMNYTTVMYNASAEKYVTFEIKTVFERETSLTFTEIKLDGEAYVSFFVKGQTVYYETLLGKEQKTRGDLSGIEDFVHFTDVKARLTAIALPLSLSEGQLSSLKAKASFTEGQESSHYTFSFGEKYFRYAAANTNGVFDSVFDGEFEANDIKVNDYTVTYSLDEDGELESVTDYNSFSVKKNGKKLNYEARVTLKEYHAKLEFNADSYKDPSVGEYM